MVDKIYVELGAVQKTLFLPSEDVSVWHEYLKRKMERGDVAREEDERKI